MLREHRFRSALHGELVDHSFHLWGWGWGQVRTGAIEPLTRSSPHTELQKCTFWARARARGSGLGVMGLGA